MSCILHADCAPVISVALFLLLLLLLHLCPMRHHLMLGRHTVLEKLKLIAILPQIKGYIHHTNQNTD